MPVDRAHNSHSNHASRRTSSDDPTRQREQELRRARGEIACIECQRFVSPFLSFCLPTHICPQIKTKMRQKGRLVLLEICISLLILYNDNTTRFHVRHAYVEIVLRCARMVCPLIILLATNAHTAARSCLE